MTNKNDMKLKLSIRESHVGGTRQAHPSAVRGLPSRSQAAGSRGVGQPDGPGPVPEMGGHLLRVDCLHGADLRPHSPWGGPRPPALLLWGLLWDPAVPRLSGIAPTGTGKDTEDQSLPRCTLGAEARPEPVGGGWRAGVAAASPTERAGTGSWIWSRFPQSLSLSVNHCASSGV